MTSIITPRQSSLLAWTIWLLGALLYSYGWFLRVTPSVMVDDLMREFAATAVVFGNLSAIYFFAYAGLQFPLGVLLDRFGPRLVLTASGMVAAAGCLLFAAARTLPVAYAGRLLIGAGVAAALIGTLKLIMIWFPAQRFATIAGITIFMGIIGGITGQAPLAMAVEAAGWRSMLAGAAAVGVLLAALIWLIVRDRADGEATSTPPAAEPEPSPNLLRGVAAILANPQTWYCGLYCGLASCPILAFAGLWGVPYAMTAYGMDRPTAAAAMSVALIGFAIGGPLWGWLSDVYARRKPILLVGVLLGVTVWLLIIYLPDPPLSVIYLLFFMSGVPSGTFIVAFAQSRELNAPQFGGSVVGIINTLSISGAAVLQPLTGYLLDLQWDGQLADGVPVYSVDMFRTAFLVYPVSIALSALLWLFLRETHCRQQVQGVGLAAAGAR